MNLFRSPLYLFLLIIFSYSASAGELTKAHIYAYIDHYKTIAISEMERSGIPASIKLAQGLLESDFGRSELANNANNHFGIKCGSTWNGKTFYKTDDDYHKGKLVESCFRAYQNGEQSYIQHTEFLIDPRKEYRYGFLFDYSSSDYVAWALGLKKAGYATDPKYPDKLIQIIEKYQLYQYDKSILKENLQEEPLLASKKSRSKKIITTKKVKTYKVKSKKRYKRNKVNDLYYVEARTGDTPQKLADMYRLPVWDLLDYNELIFSKDHKLSKGERIFLQKKKRNFKSKKYHKVRKGETMYDIAQQYGLSLEVLYSRNRINEGEEPRYGEKIQLKGIRLGKTADIQQTNDEPEFLFAENED